MRLLDVIVDAIECNGVRSKIILRDRLFIGEGNEPIGSIITVKSERSIGVYRSNQISPAVGKRK